MAERLGRAGSCGAGAVLAVPTGAAWRGWCRSVARLG
ncbi:Uncharacterised protein [Bordetella pertussis]|nr:Uncharacterised protein [Bordetella pertussis]